MAAMRGVSSSLRRAGLGIDGAFTDQVHTLARYLRENYPGRL